MNPPPEELESQPCPKHPEQDVAITCERCGVFACVLCADLGQPTMCTGCALLLKDKTPSARAKNAYNFSAFGVIGTCLLPLVPVVGWLLWPIAFLSGPYAFFLSLRELFSADRPSFSAPDLRKLRFALVVSSMHILIALAVLLFFVQIFWSDSFAEMLQR
jgi:hypothetical protein